MHAPIPFAFFLSFHGDQERCMVMVGAFNFPTLFYFSCKRNNNNNRVWCLCWRIHKPCSQSLKECASFVCVHSVGPFLHVSSIMNSFNHTEGKGPELACFCGSLIWSTIDLYKLNRSCCMKKQFDNARAGVDFVYGSK